MKKRILAFILCFALLAGMMPATVFAADAEPDLAETIPVVEEASEPEESTTPMVEESPEAEESATETGEDGTETDGSNEESESLSGTCGDNLTWTLDDEGTLTISGTGSMAEYTSKNPAPWYDSRASIQRVVMEDGVTTIGDYAFLACSSLTSITIPEGVTTIKNYAFIGCKSLTNLKLPNSLKSINYYSLAECSNLGDLVIPEGVTSIGSYAFYSSYFDSITLPDSLTQIGEYAFCTSGGIKGTFTFPKNVQYVSSGVFSMCGNLTEMIFPEGVTYISSNAFRYCYKLTDVWFPSTITGINAQAFYGLTSSNITIHGYADTVVENYANDNGFQFEAITSCANGHSYEDTVTAPTCTAQGYTTHVCTVCGDSYVDSYVDALGHTWDAGTETTAPTCSGTGVMTYTCTVCAETKTEEIPTVAHVYKYTDNGDGTHTGTCESCGAVTEPEEHQYTDGSCVCGKAEITASGTCGDNLTWTLDSAGTLTISGTGDMTNYSWSSTPWHSSADVIKNVVIGDGVTTIGNYAFNLCPNLSKVKFGTSLKSIGSYAFYSCTALQAIVVTSSACQLGDRAFSSCTSLKSVDLQNSILGVRCFYGCSALEKVTVKDTAVTCDSAFSGDSGLTLYVEADSGTIPESFWYYVSTSDNTKNYASAGFKALIIGEGITTIAAKAFYQMQDLESVELPDSLISIGKHAFNGCSSLINIVIPNSVTTIGSSAFEGCSGLNSITIPESVTSVEKDAFYRCSGLANVIISDGVTTICSGAFYGCSSMTSVTIPNSVTTVESSAFSGCTSLTDVTYAGTEEQWNAITISSGNDYLKSASIHFKETDKTIVASGTYGDDLTWTLDSEGTLAIFGSGMMPDWAGAPWSTNNENIKNVVIDSGITSIGAHAFLNCNNLIGITIPAGVTEIGIRAFEGCGSLAGVTIPEGVTTIGSDAFNGCSSLTSVTIPKGVTNVGIYTFSGCSGLANVTIPDSVTSIEDSAFSGCSSLTDVYYTGTVEQWNAITISSDNDSLKNASIHFTGADETIVAIGTCGDNGDNLTWTLDSEGTLTISGTGSMANYDTSAATPWYSSRTTIQSILIEDGVTSIGAVAFCGCSNLMIIAIPDSVTSIGESAFMFCTSLGSITIPEGVTSIGKYAFEYCSSLTSVTIPDGVTTIETMTFNGCSSLTSATIPGSVTAIESMAFFSCSTLTDVTYTGTEEQWSAIDISDGNDCLKNASIRFTGTDTTVVASGTCGDNLTWTLDSEGTLTISGTGSMKNYSYGSAPWSNSEDLAPWYSSSDAIKNVVMEEGITTIGSYAFENCSNLTSVTIPEGVTTIGLSAFSGCRSLMNVAIPEGVTTIGYGAFYGCDSLTSVAIPEGVTTIEADAFMLCNSLTNITIPESVTHIARNSFSNCRNLTSVDMPKGVTVIEELAFYGCSSLTSVTIPDGVTEIGQQTFGDCSSLTSVTIPEGFTEIWAYAFDGCSSLTDVYYTGTEEQWNEVTIWGGNDCLKNASIHVKQGDETVTIYRLSGRIAENGNFVSESGELSKNYEVYAKKDTNVAYCVQADDGYVLKDLTVGGTTIQAAVGESKYSGYYTMGDQSTTITAEFELDPANEFLITTQPKDQTATVGENVVFTVEATGEGLTYQWQYSTSGTYWFNSSMSGSDTNSLTVQAITKRNGQQYRCIVTDANGNMLTSDPATLTVKAAAAAFKITTQPKDQTAAVGETVVFAVEATGEGLTYQWQYSTSGTYWFNSSMSGSDTNSLTVQAITKRNGQQYRCIVTDANGNKLTSDSATLTVQ